MYWMLRKSMLPIYLVILSLHVACTSEDDQVLAIRIENASIYDYTDVTVESGGDTHYYGSVSSKQSSDYQSFDFAYRYAFVELQIEGKTYRLQPTDYVGERKLDSGNYTYVLNVHDLDGKYGSLSIGLKKY
jgi:hypothetical protein